MYNALILPLIFTFIRCSSISVAIVMAAIAGPQWLFTEEKLPNANYNGTANFNMMDDGAYITKYTKSSLWILCTALQGKRGLSVIYKLLNCGPQLFV